MKIGRGGEEGKGGPLATASQLAPPPLLKGKRRGGGGVKVHREKERQGRQRRETLAFAAAAAAASTPPPAAPHIAVTRERDSPYKGIPVSCMRCLELILVAGFHTVPRVLLCDNYCCVILANPLRLPLVGEWIFFSPPSSIPFPRLLSGGGRGGFGALFALGRSPFHSTGDDMMKRPPLDKYGRAGARSMRVRRRLRQQKRLF